jgi:hypothetical protein
MACCGKSSNVAYQVKFADGKTQTYSTMAEAQAAIAKTGKREGSTIRAVPK